jgi:hypothetical protein
MSTQSSRILAYFTCLNGSPPHSIYMYIYIYIYYTICVYGRYVTTGTRGTDTWSLLKRMGYNQILIIHPVEITEYDEGFF